MTKKILLIGGGKIGEAIAALLSDTPDFALMVADHSEDALARLKKIHDGVEPRHLDASDYDSIVEAATGKFAILNAGPYFLAPLVAKAASEVESHYLDLTEDVVNTRKVSKLAVGAATAFIPQCGLAPGFISIAANDLASKFDDLDSVQMRVGALPRFPTNAMKYNLTWSTEGVINEYCQPCDAIIDGQLVQTLPMEGLEEFSLDGIRYEAFNTSGGLGSMCKTFESKVNTMNYRSVRYPGHNAIMKVLLEDLNLGKRRDLLKEILESAVPATMQDVVLIFVTVSGHIQGRYLQESYASKIYDSEINGLHLSAIQITTASGILAVLDLLAAGSLPEKGLVRQEDVNLSDFLSNRFGQYFRSENIRSDSHLIDSVQ